MKLASDHKALQNGILPKTRLLQMNCFHVKQRTCLMLYSYWQLEYPTNVHIHSHASAMVDRQMYGQLSNQFTDETANKFKNHRINNQFICVCTSYYIQELLYASAQSVATGSGNYHHYITINLGSSLPSDTLQQIREDVSAIMEKCFNRSM